MHAGARRNTAALDRRAGSCQPLRALMNSIVSGALVALATALPFSCGSDESVRPAAWLEPEVRACLERSGASEALSPDALDFYRADRDADEVARSGDFFSDDFIAGVHTPFTAPDRGQAYVVYVLESLRQEVEANLDPIAALDAPDRTSVWFVPEGSAVPHRDVEACFEPA
jgi:hypothetical protein